MTAYEFDLILTADPTGDASADRLFEAFDPAGFTVTPAVVNGVSSLGCYVEAGSLEEPTLEGAIRRAIRLARDAGFPVVRVEVEPHAVAA